ncbi:unnamed protein product, partial [Brassica oleracea]
NQADRANSTKTRGRGSSQFDQDPTPVPQAPGDGISLTSRVPAAFQGRGRRGDGVGTFPKRFREAGDDKGFWGRHG